MSETAIRVEGLGKRFQISHLQQRHDTLRDALAYAARNAARRLTQPRKVGEDNSFWALRDISFTLGRGEVLGVIGANGAGKSTLLKILSRITEPTVGEAEVHGRVGSLLEVGTGFHWELSGRENIYLNGAILGMKRSEIDRKFDEIVAFAEVENFIDTPVKRYSSGMYLRLAFAVAAHLEPEILIVDEVLAVGDATFQKKCLGKMSAVAGEGRTVLFVSHNMDAIQRLCTRGIMLQKGRIVEQGEVWRVISRYLSEHRGEGAPNTWIDLSSATRSGSGEARFVAARYSSLNESVAFHPHPFGCLEFDLAIRAEACRSVESLAVNLRSPNGTKLINADSVAQGKVLQLQKGVNHLKLRIDEVYLTPGIYLVGLWLADTVGTPYDHLEAAFELEVVATSSPGLGVTPAFNGLVPCRFEISQKPGEHLPLPPVIGRAVDPPAQRAAPEIPLRARSAPE